MNKSHRTNLNEYVFPATCQFFDTLLGSSIAELYVHRDYMICVTRNQIYLLTFTEDHQLQWKNIFDCEKDIDSEGKLRKIKYNQTHNSIYSIFYQNKTPKIMIRIDLDSEEDMYFTHKVPSDAFNYSVDPNDANKIWIVKEGEVVDIDLKERNVQLMENEAFEEVNNQYLIRGKSKIEGLTIGLKGEYYYVYEHNNIKKYNAIKNELVLTLEGHVYEIEKMVFSKDMNMLIR
jgi:hypothetical protein